MRAMLVDENQNLNWVEVPDPVAKPQEVVIDVHAAGLNRADLLQRAGKYPPPPGWPEWMGLEVAGVVSEAHECSRWKKGDTVCALLGGGGYAQKVAVPEELVMSVPRGLSMVEAATLPETFATAYLNLVMEAGMSAGDTVLIHAGASGVGVAAIQLAKLMNAKVIAMVGTTDKARLVRELGADIVVNRKIEDLSKILDEHPANIALDCVGGEGLGRNIEKLATGGRWILIATLGGEQATIPLRAVLKRGVRLIGSTLRSRTNETKSQILRALQTDIWPAIEKGLIRPVVYRTLPVEQVQAAHAILEHSENIGKVALRISD